MKKTLLLSLLLAMVVFAAADTFTIGDGTSTENYIPTYGFYDYGWSKTIYTAAEINAAGLMSGGNLIALGYEVGNTPANYTSYNQMVYLRHTTAGIYEATENTLPDSTFFTLVYQGDLTWNGGGWHYVMFNAPFAWNGTDNLEIMWRNWDGDYASGYPNFRYTSTTPDYRAVYKYQDGSFPADATGTRYYNRPNLQLVTPQTTPPDPAVAIYPTVGGWAFTDASLSWQSGGGMPTSYDVYFGTSATPPFVQNQTATSYTPVLEANTTYYWQIVPVNANGPATNCPVWSFKTPSATQVAESFDDTAFPPMGWTNVDNAFTRSTTNPFYGAASTYEYIGSAGSLLYTPMLNVTAASNLDFWVRASVSTGIGRIQIKYSQNGTDWTPVGAEIALPENNIWNNYVVDLSGITPGNYFLGFNVYSSTTSSTGFYIDHVFGPEYAALAPGAVTLTAPADLAVDEDVWTSFSWTPGAGGIPTGFRIYCDTTANPSTLLADVTENSYTATAALAYSTTYYWKVVAYNAAGDAPASEVFSFTTMADPTISTFPYVVDFGTVTGDWPVANWSQLSGLYPTPTGTSSQWLRDDWLNGTSGNNAAKINIYGSSRYGWLVTPPVNVPAGEYEMKFDAALMVWNGSTPPTTDQADDRFLVIMADNPGMNNPTLLREWNNTGSSDVFNNIPATGQNYTIPLAGITGVKYFAFYGESTVSGNGDNDFMVDNVTIQEVPGAPIFTINPTSHDFGEVSLNMTATQNFVVTNTGSGSLVIQSATLSGSPMFALADLPALPASLEANQSLNFNVNFIPTEIGPHTAVLTVTDNLTRTEHTINLTGTGTTDIIVGAGNELARMPMDFYWKNSLFETLYYPDELGNFVGMITGLKFHNSFVSTDLLAKPTKIWMGTTTATDLTTGWIPSTDLIQVFDGTVDYPAGQNLITITFPQPFMYTNGQNLVMMVNRPMDTQYYNSGDNFLAQTGTQMRALKLQSDTTTYDPAAPPAATASAQFPQTTFMAEPLGDDPVFAITPESHDFGTLNVDQVASQEFVISNNGGGTLGINAIAISTNPMMSLANLPTLPVSLTTGQSVSFTVEYAPTIAGTHTATVSITDNQTARTVHTVNLTGAAVENMIPPSDLTATVMNNDYVALDWEAPQADVGEWIHYDSGLNDDSIGTGAAADFDVAIRFPASALTDYAGQSLYAVKAWPAQAGTFSIRVWTGGNASAPGQMVADQAFTPTLDTYNTVLLNTPVTITGNEELWFGYRCNVTGGYPAGCDAGPAIDGFGNMMYFQGAWSTLLDLAPTLDYNWNIQGYVGTAAPDAAPVLTYIDSSIPAPETHRATTGVLGKRGVSPRSLVVTNEAQQKTIDRALLGYKVYRDGSLLTTIDGAATTNYDDHDVTIGTYSYTVTANYSSGESDPIGPVTATIAPANNPPTDLSATVDGNDVTLNWVSPEPPQTGEWITWCQDVLGNGIGTNSAIVFDVAHRFDQTDLAPHQGGTITQVKFVPNYADCVYTIKVWTGGSASGAGTLVSSQVVPDITLAEWNLCVLTTPVPVPSTGDLYVGFEVNTQGDHPAGCDNGPVVEGKGNMMYFEGAWTTLTGLAPTLTYNWLIQTFVADGAALKAVELKPLPEHETVSYAKAPLEALYKAPARTEDRALAGFKVYRDGALIGTINDPAVTTYTDLDLPNGDYVYGVTAVYTTGESDPATVNVNVNVVLAEIILEDDFESYDNFTMTFAPWTLLDVDLSPTYGFSGISFPGSESPMAYIIFNPSATTPPITDPAPHSGAKMAASFAATTPPNNDWMITPR
ncbi:MAG: choice-of-anchor D domain-containing protein, partial [Candidatus Cloacimonetes bacterium]|nr:choice-of-anchor D domain-containing protein [Candidatus Cloacimonadota bacterium]